MRSALRAGASALLLLPPVAAAAAPPAADTFTWPAGARMALSLSFDDGSESQVRVGLPLFRRHGVAVTFYVVPSAMTGQIPLWKQAVADGHEIGNHSLTHPCSGNLSWLRNQPLESRSLDDMRRELEGASRRIEALLAVRPRTFAYPCGQSFVGRGRGTRSYVPLVAELFEAGRGWRDESDNDPRTMDLAQVMAIEMDGLPFAAIRPMIEWTRQRGGWLVLAGHEIGPSGAKTTRVDTLEDLFAFTADAKQGVWLAPVGTVAAHVRRWAEGRTRRAGR